MNRFLTALLTALFAFGSLSAVACTGDKAKDDTGGMSTPSQPKK
ncbi:hypothetical protein [Denitromonas ohlonensis]|jgi:hypothetical protein|nr:hypothetical protein [Denitromonas ohlonensis]